MTTALVYLSMLLLAVGALCLLNRMPHDAICPKCGRRVNLVSMHSSKIAAHEERKKWNGVLFEKECDCGGMEG